MKKIIITFLFVCASFAVRADIIKQWDFNSLDGVSTTGSLAPNVGSGTPAQTAGGVGNRFGTVASSATTDPNTFDNSQWRIGSNLGGDTFPTIDVSNKTTGVQFSVNTSGFENIRATWDQENSASASRYWRVQYTTNGTDWIDHSTVITAFPTGPDVDGGGTPFWQTGLSADFSAVSGVNNNPNFGIRLVSEFELTATGSGTNSYVGNRGNYGISGTLWLDMFTITGDDINPANQFPQISAIADYSILVSNTIPPFAFTISDVETAAGSLTLSASSSDPSLISGFSFDGTDGDRSLTVTPVSGKSGSAAITVRVTDAGGKSTDSSFNLTILEPSISRIFSQQTTFDVPLDVSFTVTNLPGDPALWIITGSSSNTNLVPNSGITFTDNVTNRTVTLTPVNDPASVGDTLITISVSSEGRQATASFNLRLLPGILVYYDLNAVPNSATAVAPATTVIEGLTAADLSRGPAVRAAGLTRGFSADAWKNPTSLVNPGTPSRTNALPGDYFQFSITVKPGFLASFATLDAALRRSAVNAAMNFEWQYSLDNFATPGITIPLQGPGWTALGWTDDQFTYLGRTSGTAPANPPAPYAYMIQDVPGRLNATTSPGDPIPTIDLSDIAALQDIPAGTTVTFRLFGWGNNQTVDSNTTALGRVIGPQVRGTISGTAPIALQVTRSGADILISWPASVSATLQNATTLTSPDWQTAPESVTVENGTNIVTITNPTANRFFRLFQ